MSGAREVDQPAVLAEFRTPTELRRALSRLVEAGFREVDTYSPFPVPGVGDSLALPPVRLAWYVAGAAFAGFVVSYAVQWYTNAWDYPLNAGGRAAHAWPAFLVTSALGMILGGALAAVAGLLFPLRLPALWHPVFEVEGFERASLDRMWIAVGGVDTGHQGDRAAQLLEEHGAVRIVRFGARS